MGGRVKENQWPFAGGGQREEWVVGAPPGGQ